MNSHGLTELDFWRLRRYSRTSEVVSDWGERLNQLLGRCLVSVHAQWEDEVPGPDGWWVDGPVFLNFEGVQLELGAHCNDFSVSIDTCRFDPAHVSGDDGESVLRYSHALSRPQSGRGSIHSGYVVPHSNMSNIMRSVLLARTAPPLLQWRSIINRAKVGLGISCGTLCLLGLECKG